MKKSSADFSDSTVVFDSGKNKKAKKNIVNDIFEFVELIAIAFAIILIISAFFFRHSVVSGGSMLKTLKDGEHLIISDFLYEPKFSDIVVFQLTEEQADLFPHISKSEPLIKRVIATEGQRVKIVGGRVYVNGNELIESYVYRDGIESVTDMDEITVSEGHVFVMGDHRNDSLDSRAFGEIDMRLILGRVVLRFLPIQSFGSVK